MCGRSVAVASCYQWLETGGAGLFAVVMRSHCAVAVVTLSVGGAAVRRVHAIRRDARGTVERSQYDVCVT